MLINPSDALQVPTSNKGKSVHTSHQARCLSQFEFDEATSSISSPPWMGC